VSSILNIKEIITLFEEE